MKKIKLFTLLAVMLFTASITNVAMGQVRSIVVQIDNTSTYQPTQIENGSFNDEPWMDYQVWDENWGEWKWVSNRDDGYEYNNRSINQANPHGVNEGWNTSESVVQDGTLFEWLDGGTIMDWTNDWYHEYCGESINEVYGYGIEMNAKSSAVLYQDLSTKGNDVIRWSLKHAVRVNYGPYTQSMKVEIGAPEYSGSDIVPAYGINDSVNSHIQSYTKAIYTSSGIEGSYGSNGENLAGLSIDKCQNQEWHTVRGVYMVPAGQEVTRFAFIATSSGDYEQLSGGNFLDEITFSTLIGNLSAVQLANGDVELKGYWGETDDSKNLVVKIGSTSHDVNMEDVVGENFKITIPSITIGDATSISVYHEDYEDAGRTITIHSYSQSISTANAWYLISSPIGTTVKPSDVTNMTSNDYDIFRFNQGAEMEWQNWEQTGDHYHFDLEPGRGYLYANSSTVTLTFNGTPYSGTGEVNLEYSTANSDSRMRGWNLIGNPYNVTATIGEKPFYRMNDERTNLIAADDNNIAPMEGVFVYAATNGETVTFDPSGSKESKSNDNNIVINLSDNKGTVIDRAIVSFDEGRTLPKFQIRENSTKLYIPQKGTDYAIAFSYRIGELPLNFKAEETGRFTLSFSGENMTGVSLVDMIECVVIDLNVNDTYSFIGSPTDRENRFKLVFNSSNSSNLAIFAYRSGNDIVVSGEGELQVFDVMGRMVLTQHINGVQTVDKPLQTGVYIFRLNEKVQKMVVR